MHLATPLFFTIFLTPTKPYFSGGTWIKQGLQEPGCNRKLHQSHDFKSFTGGCLCPEWTIQCDEYILSVLVSLRGHAPKNASRHIGCILFCLTVLCETLSIFNCTGTGIYFLDSARNHSVDPWTGFSRGSSGQQQTKWVPLLRITKENENYLRQ